MKSFTRSAGRKYTATIWAALVLFRKSRLPLFIRSTGTDVRVSPREKQRRRRGHISSSSRALHALFWNTLKFMFGTEIATIKTPIGGY